MPIAAVPEYLGHDFRQASPGLRFGMYLKFWGVESRTKKPMWTSHDINYRVAGRLREERAFNDDNKREALAGATQLGAKDKELLKGLRDRQDQVLQAAAFGVTLFSLDAVAVSPFTTGLGNEHPLENGFAFLSPYGLPYLPGSGVKGVLRQAAWELAGGDWGDNGGWSDELSYPLTETNDHGRRTILDRNKSPIMLSMLDVLFGRESNDGDSTHVRGALSFWDVIPQIHGDSLMVEIMTPHQSHYYQQNPVAGSANPHDSGQPIPICFLTVPPRSGFRFHVVGDLAHLRRLAPDLANNDRWKILLQAAFEHAFDWLGFGAKTAVGYGAMQEDPAVKQQREKAALAQVDEQRRASLTEGEQAVDSFKKRMTAANKGKQFSDSLFPDLRECAAGAEAWSDSDKALLHALAKEILEHLGINPKKNDKAKEVLRKLTAR